MNNSRIAGFGSYIPKLVIHNNDLAKMVDTSDEWIHTRTGIRERHIAKDESVLEMATNAAKEALADARMTPEELDMIVIATITSDHTMPSTSCLLQNELGANNAFCFDLQAACAGFLYGMDVIHQFIQSGRVKKALLIGVEKLSQIMDWSDRSSCVLFGDGAGSVVIEACEEKGIRSIESRSLGSSYKALVAPAKRNDTPYYKQMTEYYFTMDGRAVYEFAVRKVPEILKSVLAQENLTAGDIDYYVLHQANARMIETIAKRMKQPLDKFFMNMHKYGNTSSASIPIALNELRKDVDLTGKTIAISGFGAGLTYGAAIIKL